MNIKKGLIAFVLLAILIGCAKTEQEITESKSGKKPAKSGKFAEMKVIKKSPRVFQTAKYTDNVKWLNGINRNQKNQFFISIGKNDPIPITINYTLQFARSGETAVKKVYRLENQDKSSIFISLDKELDPVGDGYPNKIYVKRLQIRPGNYSKENEWKNGISLKTTGMFFFVVKKGESVPISIGDRLKFAGAGEAIVEQISPDKEQREYQNIFVKVDRTLDPVRDGAPNIIDVLVAQ